MKIKLQKNVVVIISILIIFSFFYLLRENLCEKYVQSAKSNPSESLLFTGVLSEREKGISSKIKRAEIFYNSEDYASAEKELLEVLDIDKNNSEAYKLLGAIKYKIGDFSGAEQYYAKVSALNPSSDIAIARSKNLIRNGKMSEAEGLLQENKTKWENGDLDYYLVLIEFNNNNHLPDKSLSMAEKMHKDELDKIKNFVEENKEIGNSDYALIKKADLFNSINEVDFAFYNIDEVLKNNKGYGDAYLVLGKSLFISNSYDKAREVFEKCLSLDINNSEVYFWLSEVYDRLGEQVKADDCRLQYEYLKK